MGNGKSVSRLILVPAVITLGVTLLRLVGELKHWPSPWFSAAAGGGGAVVGISWLPILFGPYFAMKLAGAGDRPASIRKALGFAFLGLLVYFAGGVWLQAILRHPSVLALLPFLLMLAAAFVPGMAWRSLGNTLIAYAFAARIPVVMVMFFAMRANDGAGWGTHYDAVPPTLAQLPLAPKFFYLGVMPQMTTWIGWTVILGSLFGSLVVLGTRRGKQPAQVSA